MGKEEKVKSGKAKSKEARVKELGDQDVSAVPYEVRMKSVTPISKPMASEKKVSPDPSMPVFGIDTLEEILQLHMISTFKARDERLCDASRDSDLSS